MVNVDNRGTGPRDPRGSNSSLYFIVGALVIAVLIIGWFLYGGNDVDMDAGTDATIVEPAGDTNVTVEDAPDAPAGDTNVVVEPPVVVTPVEPAAEPASPATDPVPPASDAPADPAAPVAPAPQ